MKQGSTLSLPKGWEIKKLGEVSDILNGGTPKTNIAEYWDGKIHWITPADLGKLRKPTVDDTPRKITRLGLEKSSAKLFPENSIILSTRAPIGHLAINEVPMSTNQGCRGIVPSKKLETWYLYYFLKKNAELLDSLGTGATFKELSTKALAGVEIPLPPLPEQQRIVSILDKAFAAIEQSRNNAEQNLKNAKELFESYLQTAFENKVHGEKFETLDSLCELIVDCEHKTAPTQETGYPSIRTPNIGKGELILENVNRVSYETYLKWTRRAVPKAGDLILAREAPAGNIAVIPENIEVCLGQRTVLLRPKKDRLISKYLAYLILSKEVQEILLSHSTGATVQHINMKDIRAFKIYNLSDLNKQISVVQKLDALKLETKKLEAVYQKKLEDLEELKKSILQKAFAGELHCSKQAE